MRAITLLFLTLMVTFTACTTSGGTYSDPAQIIRIREGSRFTIALPGNMTTGYSWDLSVPVDTEHLKLIQTEYKESQNGLIGAGGTQVFVFESVGSGTTTLQFAYFRPWEKDVDPLQTAIFQVEILK